jgi:kynureninase
MPRFEGWWGHSADTRFATERSFEPSPGAAAWQLSNPPILSMAPLAASLALFEEATLGKLRAKSLRLTRLLEDALVRACGERIEVLTPSDPAARGAQLSVRVEPAARERVAGGLRSAGVVADWRADVVRLAPAPLYNTFRDVVVAAQALGAALATP